VIELISEIDKNVWIYVVVVIVLIGGVVMLWPRNNQIVKNTPKAGEIVVEDKGKK
jgi:hypothetical protein